MNELGVPMKIGLGLLGRTQEKWAVSSPGKGCHQTMPRWCPNLGLPVSKTAEINVYCSEATQFIIFRYSSLNGLRHLAKEKKKKLTLRGQRKRMLILRGMTPTTGRQTLPKRLFDPYNLVGRSHCHFAQESKCRKVK